MTFHSLATAILIASTTVGPVLPQTSGSVVPSFPAVTEAAKATLPSSAIELLVSIRSALEKDELLNGTFYSIANMQKFFGVGYRFNDRKDEVGQRTIVFDDRNNIYIDEQVNLTLLGRNRPCLWGGTIQYYAGSPGHKATSGISMMTTGGAWGACTISADMVKQIFGEPNTVTEGFPTTPPPDGLPYITPPQTNELGNRWLTYRVELSKHLQYAKFRTIGDATVIEIQLVEVQR